MRVNRLFGILAIVAICLALPGRGDADYPLLMRMAALNPNLHSYTATMHAHVALTTFPYISADLVGTYYHQDPNFDKLVITQGLPGIASQFSKLYPHIVPPAQWNQVFMVKLVSDDGSHTLFNLVPRKRGNVDHIDARVDDKTATITSMRWDYINGGSASMNNSYSSVAGNSVVTSQTGQVDEPVYKGDITATLGDYRINPKLPASTFQKSQ